MIYDNAIEQVKGAKKSEDIIFRLAKVTSITSGKRAYVQIYGESSASNKLYPYIAGYTPTVGDDVLMAAQGSTYIILGKISRDNPGDYYYLTKAAADLLYLTQAAADERYMQIGTTLDTDKLKSGSYTFTLDSTTLKPSGDGTFALGTSSYKLKEIYANILSGKWMRNPAQDSYGFLEWTAANEISPYSTGQVSLGTSSRKLDKLYASEGHFDSISSTTMYGGQWKHSNSTGAGYLAWDSSSTILGVKSSDNVNLGSSTRQFGNVYAKQFYQNGTAISTSDRRKKTGIKDITKKYVEFFKKLKPKLFRFKDGTSGRLHAGFIAQDVEEAAGESGIPTKDLAFLCIDDNGDYGLRYEELIAIQTKIIQDLLERVEALEKNTQGRSKT